MSSSDILLVTDAPGRKSPIDGGWMVESVLQEVGVGLAQVEVAHVHPVPGAWPANKRGFAQRMAEYADQLDEVVAGSQAKVVVALGGVALTRLTGLSDITNWRGSTLVGGEPPLTEVMEWCPVKLRKNDTVHFPSIGRRRVWPRGAMCVPTLAPSGIVKDPSRSDLFLLRRDFEKVAKIVRGEWRKLPYRFNLDLSPSELVRAFEGAQEIYFDTEFNPEACRGGMPYVIGMTCNGYDVCQVPLKGDYIGAVRHILENPTSLKSAHNILADVRSLANIHITVAGEWWCSMVGFYVLHAGTEVGLSPTSRYYLDHVQHRKWMAHEDPDYNCFDVLYGWHSRQGQLREYASFPVDRMGEAKVRMRLLRTTRVMEDRGMFVDRATQARLRSQEEEKIARLRGEIDGAVRERWEARVGRRQAVEQGAKDKRAEAKLRLQAMCPKHKTGWQRLPTKGLALKGCRCLEMWESGEAKRAQQEWEGYKGHVKGAGKGLKKEAEGFNPRSGAHLKWFLYDPDGLRLPIQRDYKTKRITTGAAAIEKLSKLAVVKKRPDAWAVVSAIKAVQESEKAISTFINVEVDEWGWAHPSYKIHGTVTGRLAGGADTIGEADKAGEEGFNPLNIPDDWRCMYAAPQGYAFVYADWAGQESRLVAYFYQDARYLQQYQEEDAGGVDVHSQGAAILFNIDPKDAKETLVKMAGREMSARQAAKVGRHAWAYSAIPYGMVMHQLGCDLREAARIDEVLSDAYPQVVSGKKALVEEVLGRYEIMGNREVNVSHNKYLTKQVQRGRGWVANPFGWVMTFAGRGDCKKHPITGEHVALPYQANEVLAARQQSTGASMWARCAVELGEWGAKVFGGAYDSIILLVEDNPLAIQAGRKQLEKSMTKGWEEMNGMKFPAEYKWGYHLGGGENGLRSF